MCQSLHPQLVFAVGVGTGVGTRFQATLCVCLPPESIELLFPARADDYESTAENCGCSANAVTSSIFRVIEYVSESRAVFLCQKTCSANHRIITGPFLSFPAASISEES